MDFFNAGGIFKYSARTPTDLSLYQRMNDLIIEAGK